MHKFPIDIIPLKGYLLAYFRHGFLFDAYEVRDGSLCCQGLSQYADDEMTECHLFSHDAEYRAIYNQSRGKWITAVLDKRQEELMAPDLIYTQQVVLRKEYSSPELKHLVIVNRYEYSANDTLVLKNYRISY